MTFAEQAEKIGRKRGKYEKLLKSPTPSERNTAERMLGRMDTMLSTLQQTQEQIAPTADESVPVMGTGGWLGMGEETSGFQMEETPSFEQTKFFPQLGGAPRNFGNPQLSNAPQTTGTEPPSEEGGILPWAKDNKDTLGNVGMSLLGAAISQRSINKMQEPSNPTFAPHANFDSNVDVSAQENQINRDHIIRDRAVSQGLRDNNVIQAFKGKTFADTINAKNKLYASKNDKESELKRTKLFTDYRTNVYNAGVKNKHNSDLSDFRNNKAAATGNNWNNAIKNFRLGQNDLFQNKMDGVRLDTLSKQFEESQVMDRMMNDPEYKAKLKKLYPNMFK